jgi:hypothetical protein
MPNYYLQPLPFLVTQDPTKWQGERIRGKRWEINFNLINAFNIKTSLPLLQGMAWGHPLARWGKNKCVEIFY